jgi:hypothetical protein
MKFNKRLKLVDFSSSTSIQWKGERKFNSETKQTNESDIEENRMKVKSASRQKLEKYFDFCLFFLKLNHSFNDMISKLI